MLKELEEELLSLWFRVDLVVIRVFHQDHLRKFSHRMWLYQNCIYTKTWTEYRWSTCTHVGVTWKSQVPSRNEMLCKDTKLNFKPGTMIINGCRFQKILTLPSSSLVDEIYNVVKLAYSQRHRSKKFSKSKVYTVPLLFLSVFGPQSQNLPQSKLCHPFQWRVFFMF